MPTISVKRTNVKIPKIRVLASVRFTLSDEAWNAILVSEALEANGSAAAAYCDVSKNQIVFSTKHRFDQHIVIHELTHAFSKYLYLDTANVGWQDVEEIMCEFLGANLMKMAKLARDIHNGLKKGAAGKSG